MLAVEDSMKAKRNQERPFKVALHKFLLRQFLIIYFVGK